MMMISVLMLSSASYAWFSISVAPDVKNIKTTVTANENFEIALGNNKPANEPALDDSGKNETWGGLVTFGDADLAGTGLGPATILESDTKTLVSATYGSDGRPNGTEAISFSDIDSVNKPGISVGKDKAGNIVATRISLWLRSNKDGKVTTKLGDVTGTAAAKAKVGVQLGTDGIIKDLKSSEVVEVGSLEANKEKQVFVYVYLDGPNVTAADVAAASDVTIASISFTSDGVTGGNSYDGSYGKPASSGGGTN